MECVTQAIADRASRHLVFDQSGATAFPLAVLVFTKSRGAWLGLPTGLAVLVILRWSRWGSAAVLVIFLAVSVFLASHIDLAQDLLAGGGAYSTITSLQGREEIWTRAIAQIKDFPLTGMGMGTFPQVSRALYPYFILTTGENPHAHNLYLQIAVDLGLLGLAVWFVMALVVTRCAWQVYRARLRQAA